MLQSFSDSSRTSRTKETCGEYVTTATWICLEFTASVRKVLKVGRTRVASIFGVNCQWPRVWTFKIVRSKSTASSLIPDETNLSTRNLYLRSMLWCKELEYAILEVSGSRHYPEISLLPKEKMKAEENWRSEKKRRRRTRRRRRRRANKRKDRFTRYDFCRIQLPYDTLTTLFRPRLSQGFKMF